jgi:subtilase family serine protease
MKNGHLMLRASIVAALATAPAWSFASTATVSGAALAGLRTAEAPRVTQLVDNKVVSTLPQTHLGLLSKLSPGDNVDDATPMHHLQLVLRPSVLRSAQLRALIDQQHNPASARFHQWLTPEQFGQNFGAVDSDVASVTAWLTAQGFTVNTVYPNRLQIDFSGTAGQVKAAFQTQEKHYTFNGEDHIANASDIRVPTALHSVVAGVAGLNDLRPNPMHSPARTGTWNASTHKFKLPDAETAKAGPLAVPFQGGTRGLVPNDLARMYGVSTIRNNGVTGKNITIAVVEDGDMVPSDWTNFVSQFNLGSFGGTFTQVNPAPPTGTTNCLDPDGALGVDAGSESIETVLDAEWATAIAPSAHIVVASCSDYDSTFHPASSNFFDGVFIAATNVINASSGRPDIISASYGYGENYVDSASKTAIDAMWAQADAEGISVFVSTGDSGSNPSFNGGVISGASVDSNAFATSPNVTAVGGTDTADVLDGTTSKYFSATFNNAVYGTALGYVPEIPWNESCGNGVAAKVVYGGFPSAPAYCQFRLKYDPLGKYVTSEAGSGGPSAVDAKPSWQMQVHNAASDQSRDVPDVSLFAGSFGNATAVVLCTAAYPCAPNFTTPTVLEGGTSLSSPMFAGIQALIDQGIAMRGLPTDQGNAAPTLYALASKEYGNASGAAPASLAACNADNGNDGTAGCVFHNVTRGSISTECFGDAFDITTGCYILGSVEGGDIQIGLTTTDTTPTGYSPSNKAFGAQPGWSFATGLGSVNTTNLLIAWRGFVNAPPAAPAP